MLNFISIKTVYLDFRDSLSNEDSEIYEDPDTVNFEAPSRPFPPQHVDTSGDEANYEEPSDADYELPPDSGFKMFTPKGILLYILQKVFYNLWVSFLNNARSTTYLFTSPGKYR